MLVPQTIIGGKEEEPCLIVKDMIDVNRLEMKLNSNYELSKNWINELRNRMSLRVSALPIFILSKPPLLPKLYHMSSQVTDLYGQ